MDALDRVVSEVDVFVQPSQDGTNATFTFDAAGQQITEQSFLGVRTYGYDLNGRQTRVAYPTGFILTFAYDSVSNRTTLLDPDGGTTTYSYDAQNRLTSILNPVSEITTISWDALDREKSRVKPRLELSYSPNL